MLSEKILWIVPVLSFIGSARYIYDVARGKAKPNRITWLLWALAPLIAFAAEIKQGVGLQSIVTFTSGFSPLIILIVSFLHKKSVWQITKFDIVCGVLSFLGLILWLMTRHGNIAILFSIFADCLAGVPTLIKSYKDPSSESPLVFMFGGISAILTLLTIDHWTFAAYGFPAYLLLMCAALVFLIVTRIGEQRGIKKSELPFGEAEL